MIRGKHVQLTVLGAMEVSEKGDIANWKIPGKMVKGMGGAMDLVAGVKKVLILMEHNAKDGQLKLLKKCTLPLTGRSVVNTVITDLGKFDILLNGIQIKEIAPGVSIDEIRSKTEATIIN